MVRTIWRDRGCLGDGQRGTELSASHLRHVAVMELHHNRGWGYFPLNSCI